VCGQIIPWNFPFLMAVWKIAPALAAGNCVVLKPASYTPLSALKLIEIIHDTGLLPPGVLNFITGPGSVVGNELCLSPLVDKIAFTGSTEVGRQIMQTAGTIKKVTPGWAAKPEHHLDGETDIAIDGSLWATAQRQRAKAAHVSSCPPVVTTIHGAPDRSGSKIKLGLPADGNAIRPLISATIADRGEVIKIGLRKARRRCCRPTPD
jgi:aldehyde dehydrogenase (NAD+)